MVTLTNIIPPKAEDVLLEALQYLADTGIDHYQFYYNVTIDFAHLIFSKDLREDDAKIFYDSHRERYLYEQSKYLSDVSYVSTDNYQNTVKLIQNLERLLRTKQIHASQVAITGTPPIDISLHPTSWMGVYTKYTVNISDNIAFRYS